MVNPGAYGRGYSRLTAFITGFANAKRRLLAERRFYQLKPGDGFYNWIRQMIRECLNCKTSFNARAADVKRGWAKFCSKSCKASHQERRTGQHAAFKAREYQREFGGIPQFDRRGEYEGFVCIPGSDDHDCNKD